MKKFLLLLVICFGIFSLQAQKVAIIGVNSNPDASNDGGFSILALEDLSAGEVYYFTENEYDNPTNQFNSIGESVLKITISTTITKGNVIYINEIAANTFSNSVTTGSGSVAINYIAASGNFSISSNGESLYLYTDTNDDPSDGVTEIHSAFYAGTFSGDLSTDTTGGSMPTSQNPSSDYANAIIIHNFPVHSYQNDPYFSKGVNRVEYNTSVSDRTDVNKVKLENASNYVFGGTHQDLSTTKFTNFSLVTSNPTVTLTKNISQLDENSASNFVFTLTASEAPSSNLVINFDVNDGITSATATFGSDYTQSGATTMNNTSGTVTIASGTTTKTITINPIGNTTLEPDETLKINISSGTGYDATSPSSQTVLIVNDDTKTVVPDISVCGIRHYSGTEDDISEFSFVALKDLAAGSSYIFSSNDFDKNSISFIDVSTRPSELKWTAASGGLSRGDVIVVKKTALNTFTITKNGSTTNAGTVTKLSPSKKFYIEPLHGLFIAHTDNDDDPYNGILDIQSVIFTYDNLGNFGGNIPAARDVSTLYLGSILVDGFPNTAPEKFEYKPTLKPGTTVDQANFENPSNWNYSETLSDLDPTSFNNIIVSEGAVNPKASITVSASSILEDTETATYTFTLDEVATANTTINFSVTGAAVFSSDYTVTGSNTFTASTGSIVIATGTSTTQLTINPVTDINLEIKENILLTIISGDGYDGGSPSSASVAITNDDANNDVPLLAIIGVNHESPSSMSLVAVNDIPANETFYFLRNQFDKETLSFESGGRYRLVTPNTCLPKGTVLIITGAQNGPLTVNCNGTSGATDCGTATIEGSGNVFDFLDVGTRYHVFQDDDSDQTNGISQIHSVFHTGGTYPALHTGGTLTPEENPKSVYANAVVVDGFPTTPNPNKTEFDATKRATDVTTTLLEDVSNYVHAQANAILSETNFNAAFFAIKYVNIEATPGGDGASWATAYNSLQDALANASNCFNNEIWVAKGTYKPHASDESVSFVIPKNAVIYGGFNGTETPATERNWNTNQTILSGDLDSSNSANIGDSHTILQIENNTVIIDGFIVEYGYADASSGIIGTSGAGIYSTGTDVTFKNSIFKNLTAQGNGNTGNGGVFFNTGSLTFNNSLFYNNIATNDGGVGYSDAGQLNLINCTISKNTADSGGGFALNTSNATISNSIFHSNVANTHQDIAQLSAGVATISYSTFGIGLTSAVTNAGNNYTFFDPSFLDPNSNNFRIKLSSQTINTGNDAINTETKDLFGNDRKLGTIDRGAYEYDAEITEWSGMTNSDWDNPNNWFNGVPSATKSAFLLGGVPNEPIVNITGALAKDIVIENFMSLTIDASKSFTINRDFTNNGSLIIKSDASNNGSMIVEGNYTGTGNATYQRYVTASANPSDPEGWHLVSSPVNGQNINTFKGDVLRSGVKYAIAPYNNSLATNRYQYYTDNTGAIDIDAAGFFLKGKGYSVKRSTAGTFNFSGTLFTEDVSIAITDNSSGVGNKWNLVGNPFASAINLNDDANATNNFLRINTTKLAPAKVAIYQWNATTSSYDVYNHATGSAKYIAPGQGFFVNAVDGGETITFTEAMQTHQTGNIFSKTANTTPEINLTISDGKVKKSTQIKYFDNTTTGLDIGYDAGIFSGNSTSFDIFTHLVSDSKGDNFALQCLPNQDFESLVIPVGINIEANKNITISVETLNLSSEISVYLEDKKTNTFINLNDENYSFTSTEKMNGIGRFFLHTSSKALSVDDNFTSENISIYKSSNTNLRIAGLEKGKAKVVLFDILGKQVLQTNFIGKYLNDVELPNLKSGVYLVCLKSETVNQTKKIIIE